MLKIGVLVSGGGTNLQALIDKIESGYLKECEIVTVISSKHDAYALERAKKHNINSVVISKKEYLDIDDYDKVLMEHLKKYNVELVVLAGFLSILGNRFINEYENKIINIHPALVPAFSGKGHYGLKPHIEAVECGVKITGATVHFVNNETDAGPIILQKAVCVKDNDTPEKLQKRVMEEAEWEILPEAVKLFSEGRLKIEGKRVKIIKE